MRPTPHATSSLACCLGPEAPIARTTSPAVTTTTWGRSGGRVQRCVTLCPSPAALHGLHQPGNPTYACRGLLQAGRRQLAPAPRPPSRASRVLTASSCCVLMRFLSSSTRAEAVQSCPAAAKTTMLSALPHSGNPMQLARYAPMSRSLCRGALGRGQWWKGGGWGAQMGCRSKLCWCRSALHEHVSATRAT